MTSVARVLLCCCCLVAAQAEVVTVSLKPVVTLPATVATIGDIADCSGHPDDLRRLEALAVQRLPDAGERAVDAAQVRAVIVRNLPDLAVRVEGSTRLRRALRHFAPEVLQAAAVAELESRLGVLGDDCRLLITRAPPAIDLPAVADEPYQVIAEPLSLSDWGEIPYRVRIVHQGVERRRVLLIFRLERYRDVLVARRDIARGQIVVAGDLHVRRQLITDRQTAEAPVIDEAIGCKARCPIPAGGPVTWGILHQPPVVVGGSRIQIMVHNDAFTLSVEGVAMGDGLLGEEISVRPNGRREMLRGRVVGPGRVAIDERR